MTEIIDSPAQQLTIDAVETFDEFVKRIQRKRFPLKHADGKRIALSPGTVLSLLVIELEERSATPVEFMTLFDALMETVAQFEKQGRLPIGWVKRVRTPLDVQKPEIPSRFLENLNGEEIKFYLDGQVFFSIEKEYLE